MPHTNNKEVERIEEIIENIVAGVAEYPHGRLALAVDLREQLRTILHQELQKARHDWLREEVVKLEGMKKFNSDGSLSPFGEERYRGHNDAIKTIINRYSSELNQPIS